MFALSRNGEKAFFHQPDNGMAVPILLDLNTHKVAVQVPSIGELEHDYAIYENFHDLIEAAGPKAKQSIEGARKFSVRYSKKFGDQIASSNLTVAAIRKLVTRHWQGLQAGVETKGARPVSVAAQRAAAARARYRRRVGGGVQPVERHARDVVFSED